MNIFLLILRIYLLLFLIEKFLVIGADTATNVAVRSGPDCIDGPSPHQDGHHDLRSYEEGKRPKLCLDDSGRELQSQIIGHALEISLYLSLL